MFVFGHWFYPLAAVLGTYLLEVIFYFTWTKDSTAGMNAGSKDVGSCLRMLGLAGILVYHIAGLLSSYIVLLLVIVWLLICPYS